MSKLNLTVRNSADCNSLKIWNCTDYCRLEYDIEYISPQVKDITDVGPDADGRGEIQVTANTANTTSNFTFASTDYEWTYTDHDGTPTTLTGATTTLTNVKKNGTTVVKLTFSPSGGTLTTASMNFLITTYSNGELFDYWVPNTDITVDDAPEATFTSDVLTMHNIYNIANEEYYLYTLDTANTQSTPYAVTYDMSTTSAPGLSSDPLTTSTQFFKFRYDYAYLGSGTVNSTIAFLFTQTDCSEELVEAEIATIQYHIEDPSGTSDTIDITVADFTDEVNPVIIDFDSTSNNYTFTNIGSLDDGMWKITATVTTSQSGNTLSFIAYVEKPIVCTIDCKIARLMHDVISENCKCEDWCNSKTWRLITTDTLLRAALRAAGCNKTTEFNNILAKVEDLMANTDCKNC